MTRRGDEKRAAREADEARREAVLRGVADAMEPYRAQAVVAEREAAARPRQHGGPQVQTVGDRGPALWVTFGVIGLIVIGAFGPWATALGISESGTAGSNDGWLLVGAAVLSALFTWGYRTNGSRGLCVLIALAGIGGFAVALHDRHHVEGSGSALIQVGWGLNLDLVGSAVLVVMAVVLASRSKFVDQVGAPTVTPAVAVEAHPQVDAPTVDSKVCPDCAETIAAAAKVCKYCGYRYQVCPDCAEPIAAEARVCRHCGHRFAEAPGT